MLSVFKLSVIKKSFILLKKKRRMECKKFKLNFCEYSILYQRSYFSESIGILIEVRYILWQCKDLWPKIIMCTGYTTLEWPPLQNQILAVPVIGFICI